MTTADTLDPTRLTPELLEQLKGWEGRSETLSDEISAAPVRSLSATLDRDDPPPLPGTFLPPLWHWLSRSGAWSHARLTLRSCDSPN